MGLSLAIFSPVGRIKSGQGELVELFNQIG
jgi:hypothetical protein